MPKVTTIQYPNSGRISEFVNVSAQGRNGYMKQTGIEVLRSEVGVIRLTPINSKSQPGNCCVELPNDPAVIKQFINALIKINKEE